MKKLKGDKTKMKEVTKKYECINYNRVLELCDLHEQDCEFCRLYQPKVIRVEELSEEILRTHGNMRCWEGDD